MHVWCDVGEREEYRERGREGGRERYEEKGLMETKGKHGNTFFYWDFYFSLSLSLSSLSYLLFV
jgi:hypothetical protein